MQLETNPTTTVAAAAPAAPAARNGKTFRERAYDVAMAVMDPLARMVERSSLIPTTPFLSVDHVPGVRVLEENWREIRAELDGVLSYQADLPAFHHINADVTDIAHDDWKTFFFCGFGFESKDNCARCPRTAALLRQVPGVVTAFFSILSPGVRVPPHRGAWKGVIRYHLALKVPEPAEGCGLRLDGQVVHWREGQSLVFDDTYEHAVWNETEGTRVVLFLDLVRPCRVPGSWINQAVMRGVAMSPFLRDARRRHLAWERAFAVKHGARP